MLSDYLLEYISILVNNNLIPPSTVYQLRQPRYTENFNQLKNQFNRHVEDMERLGVAGRVARAEWTNQYEALRQAFLSAVHAHGHDMIKRNEHMWETLFGPGVLQRSLTVPVLPPPATPAMKQEAGRAEVELRRLSTAPPALLPEPALPNTQMHVAPSAQLQRSSSYSGTGGKGGAGPPPAPRPRNVRGGSSQF